MLSPRSLRPALVAAAVGLTGLAAGAGAGLGPVPSASAAPAAAPAPAEPASPLAVTIESLTPGALPRSGPLRITGSVTNRDDQPWSTIRLYPFLGSTPMTTTAELAAAAQVPEEQDVGGRVTEVRDTVEELAPGETATFEITVPRSRIARAEAGVYWFGVHALGQGPDGDDDLADGRARTFLPLITRATRGEVSAALVVPLRRGQLREADGSMADVPGWTRTLRRDGRLGSLVELGAAAGDRPVTWLLDPALVDAVRRLAAGNPPRSLGPSAQDPADGPVEDPAASSAPDAAFSPSGDGTPTGGTGGEDGDGDGGDEDGEGDDERAPTHEPTPQEQAAAEAASAWLERLAEAVTDDEVLTLPYGDLDMAAAASLDPDVYARARSRSTETAEEWGIPTTPAVASPSGYLDLAALRLADPDDTVLATDRMFGEDPPGVATVDGRRLVVTSSGAAAGGPGPDDPQGTLAMRQRFLAESAVHLLSPGRRPVVLQLPADWTPGADTDFFAGLDLDWLDLTTVADATDRTGTPVPAADLAEPDRQDARGLESAAFESSRLLSRSGEVLQHVLRDNSDVAREIDDQALAALSYAAREAPIAARASVDASRRWVDARLREIRIEAPSGVALSSANGRFGATVVNGLDEPVEVSIQAVTEDPAAISIEGPETVEVGAGSSTTVLLDATTREPGVHNVTLVLTDHTDDPEDQQTPLGSADQLPIRSIQVSNVIWLIMGAGGLLLFGTIAVRAVRRIRAARAEANA